MSGSGADDAVQDVPDEEPEEELDPPGPDDTDYISVEDVFVEEEEAQKDEPESL